MDAQARFNKACQLGLFVPSNLPRARKTLMGFEAVVYHDDTVRSFSAATAYLAREKAAEYLLSKINVDGPVCDPLVLGYSVNYFKRGCQHMVQISQGDDIIYEYSGIGLSFATLHENALKFLKHYR